MILMQSGSKGEVCRSACASQYVVVAAAKRKHKDLQALLAIGTSWLNMYQATDRACTESSGSHGQEQLAAAAKATYELYVRLEVSMLRAARDDQT